MASSASRTSSRGYDQFPALKQTLTPLVVVSPDSAANASPSASTNHHAGSFDISSQPKITSSSSDANRTTEYISQHPDSSLLNEAQWRRCIPSKVQQITDGSKGNFSVLQMGIFTPDPTDRLSTAQKTSEDTAAASKAWNEAGYQSLGKLKQRWGEPPNRRQSSRDRRVVQGNDVSDKKLEPLTPRETKAEQARLLTLLRSLNPTVVVDQLCKGLAYFGGIPMAPPPAEDEAFPSSDSGNGPGSVFVGWLAEIFPVSASSLNGGEGVKASRATDVPLPPKKKRGRPVGSKSTKVRSDKGKTHVSKKRDDGAHRTISTVSGAAIETGSFNFDVAVCDSGAAASSDALLDRIPPPTVANPTGTGAESKKRGRPKGSKNRVKAKVVENGNLPEVGGNTTASNQASHVTGTVLTGTSPKGGKLVAAGQPVPTANMHATAIRQDNGPAITGAIGEPSRKRSQMQPDQQDQAGGALELGNEQLRVMTLSPSAKRRRVAKLSNMQDGVAAQRSPADDGSQPHELYTDFHMQGAASSQMPQLGTYYVSASPHQLDRQQRHQQQQQLHHQHRSPQTHRIMTDLSQVLHGQTMHNLVSQGADMVSSNNYDGHVPPQLSPQQMRSAKLANGGFTKNTGTPNAHSPQDQPQQLSSATPSISPAPTHQSRYDNPFRASILPPSLSAAMGSYSTFDSSGFM